MKRIIVLITALLAFSFAGTQWYAVAADDDTSTEVSTTDDTDSDDADDTSDESDSDDSSDDADDTAEKSDSDDSSDDADDTADESDSDDSSDDADDTADESDSDNSSDDADDTADESDSDNSSDDADDSSGESDKKEVSVIDSATHDGKTVTTIHFYNESDEKIDFTWSISLSALGKSEYKVLEGAGNVSAHSEIELHSYSNLKKLIGVQGSFSATIASWNAADEAKTNKITCDFSNDDFVSYRKFMIDVDSNGVVSCHKSGKVVPLAKGVSDKDE